MLKLKVEIPESWDESKNVFVPEVTVDIELEHSLASVSKWEMIWEKPLLSTQDKTDEMNFSYIECMCITPNTPKEVFYALSKEQQEEVAEYLDKKHTATWFGGEDRPTRKARIITSELIYYWMNSFRIDWEAQYWPLNRLLTLIQVHDEEQEQKKPRQRTRSQASNIVAINARRRAEMKSNG